MRHPLESLRDKRQAFGWLLAATVVLTLALQLMGPADPTIVQFEFTWNSAAADALIHSWSTEQQLRAAFSLGLDFLYLPLYSTTIALACLWATEGRPESWQAAGRWFAWGAWGAAVFDAVENLALYRLLLGPATDAAALLSSLCATAKFTLIALGIGFAIAALLTGRRGQAAA